MFFFLTLTYDLLLIIPVCNFCPLIVKIKKNEKHWFVLNCPPWLKLGIFIPYEICNKNNFSVSLNVLTFSGSGTDLFP